MMARSWTMGQQIAFGFVVPLIIMSALGVISYQSTQGFLRERQTVKHTHEVRVALVDLLSMLREAESGQRGFVLTGQEEYLAPYQEAAAAVERQYDNLRALTVDNASQQARLDRLRRPLQEKLADLARVVDVRSRGGLDPAVQIVAAGQGKRLKDEIRAILAEALSAEEDLLRQRSSSTAAAAERLSTTLSAGTAFTVLIVLGIALQITRGVRRRIGSAVQHMRSASAELTAAATQQARGARDQVAVSSEVSTTARELVSTARWIAQSAQHVTRSASATATAAAAGDHTVQSAQDAILGVKRQVDRIVMHMVGLGKKSQEIGGILDLIDDLAYQTNILAINATIESVGAGEAGRRFAVVADEIRKLADRVSSSTKDVSRLIEDIRSAANTTLMATEDGSKAVDGSAQQFIEVTSSFRKIVEYVLETAEASRGIEQSTRQQTAAVEQVSVALEEVSQTALETEASSAQTLKTASEIADLSGQLLQIVTRQRQPISA